MSSREIPVIQPRQQPADGDTVTQIDNNQDYLDSSPSSALLSIAPGIFPRQVNGNNMQPTPLK
jgi:hypothetical protein